MLDFCIIGSGISGSTIAHHLSKKYSVHILDKARGPGGRASNKRFKQNLSFDHGVQYISPKSKEFLKFIKTLCKKKEAKIWTGNHLDFTFENLLHVIGKKLLVNESKLDWRQFAKDFVTKHHLDIHDLIKEQEESDESFLDTVLPTPEQLLENPNTSDEDREIIQDFIQQEELHIISNATRNSRSYWG